MPTPTPYEEDSVTDIYTTDGTAIDDGRSKAHQGADGGGGAPPSGEVEEELHKIMQEYQIQIPRQVAGREDPDISGMDGSHYNIHSSNNTFLDDMTSTRSMDYTDGNSIFTDNEVFQANLEAEERKIMSGFNYDYDTQLSLDGSNKNSGSPDPIQSGAFEDISLIDSQPGSRVRTITVPMRTDFAADSSIESGSPPRQRPLQRMMARLGPAAAACKSGSRTPSTTSKEEAGDLSPSKTENTATGSPGGSRDIEKGSLDDLANDKSILGPYAGPVDQPKCSPPSVIILGPDEGKTFCGGVGDAGKRMKNLMCKTWTNRIICFLIVVILVAIGVSLGSYLHLRNIQANQTSAGSQQQEDPSTGSGIDFTLPPDDVEPSRGSGSTETPDDTYEPTDFPTELPSAAPGPPIPTTSPTVTCVDSASASIYINSNVGFKNCNWLSTRPGPAEYLCRPGFEAYTACPITCQSCPTGTTWPTSVPLTDKPSVTPVAQPTYTMTGAPSAVTATMAPSPKLTPSPSQVPSDAPSLEPSRGTSAPTSQPVSSSPTKSSVSMSVINAVMGASLPSTSSSLQDNSSPQSKALHWVVKSIDDAGTRLSEEQIVQRFAVATLGYSLSVDQWTDQTSWLDDSNGDVCGWFGVVCNNQGTVRAITLRDNGLRGTLPDEIAMLADSLARLDIGENDIGGEIPTIFGLLGNLRTLFMDLNNFEGQLPTEIGRMSSLQQWHLHRNNLVGDVPGEIAQLEGLEELLMWENGIVGTMPRDVCRFRNLEKLEIDCKEIECDCWTRCYYQCGGNTGVPCDGGRPIDRALGVTVSFQDADAKL